MKAWQIVLSVVLCIVLIIGVAAGVILHDLGKSIDTNEINTDNLGVTQGLSDKVINIALFGVDARSEGATTRSDTIIILSVDNKNSAIKISSIMRDSYVTIPGHGKDKINHAYAFGGPELAIATLNENFDLNITHYASVDFGDMAEIVDSVGGVTIDVASNEVSMLNALVDEQNKVTGSKSPHISKGGTQLLNGTQATAYARIRYVGNGDYQRTERQRTVLMALFNKMLAQPVSKYPEMAKAVFAICETNFKLSDLPAYLPFVLKKPSIYLNRFPQDSECHGGLIDGIYYMSFEEEKTVQKLHDFIYNYAGETADEGTAE